MTDLVDVRLALAQLVASLFARGAYEGHFLLYHLLIAEVGACYLTFQNIPPLICQMVQTLACDESVDIQDAVCRIDLAQLPLVEGSIEAPKMPWHSIIRQDITSDGDGESQGGYFQAKETVLENSESLTHPASIPPTTMIRRPSAEVAARFDSMQLESDRYR